MEHVSKLQFLHFPRLAACPPVIPLFPFALALLIVVRGGVSSLIKGFH